MVILDQIREQRGLSLKNYGRLCMTEELLELHLNVGRTWSGRRRSIPVYQQLF
ncbi:hypothetical protein [Thalassobius sp. I31.1]|uniref:hypothetical protein n=1 Tax=Thalassobius sp. I31.1 TaxID=2109912 RepID=UPI0018E50867|nr:hypothetical protein [Thalassobius sp. I31.1]